MKKMELQPGETCPYCGQTKRRKKTMIEKQIEANQKTACKAAGQQICKAADRKS